MDQQVNRIVTPPPLFIFGMPRSGTKLIRELLNTHDYISIPSHETHFIPYLLQNYGHFEILDKEKIINIQKTVISSNFFFYFKKESFKELPSYFFINLIGSSIQIVIMELLKFFSKSSGDYIIWGDKTPEHINNIPLLNKYFPNARFVHIIRDPRDYAISMKKTWGKNMYLAAHNWNQSVVKLRSELDLQKNIIEIKYESLLEQPEKVLSMVTSFLNLEFEAKMLQLEKPSENLGDAKGLTNIKSNNTNKYRTTLTKGEIKKIEEISFEGLSLYSYPIIYAKKERELSKYLKKFYLFQDIYYRQKFNFLEYGIIDGFKFGLSGLGSKNS